MKKALMIAGTWLALHAFAGTQIGGCGAGSGGLGLIPATVIVVNNPDSFTVAISGFDYDGTVDQMWDCSTPQANLTIGSSMSAGSVDVTIYDGAGNVVYSNSHSAIGGLTVQTRPGGDTTALWRVVMSFSDATIAGAITLDADTLPDPDEVTLASAFGSSDFYLFHAGWGNVQANVNIGGVSSGTLNVVIRDGSNAVVFNQAVTGAVNTQTLLGAAGIWTIELDFGGATLAGAVSITSP